MHKLSRTQQPNDQELLLTILNYCVAQLPRSRQAFYSAKPDKCISLNENWER